MADPQILGSALMNVLNNAFKYTAPGGRVVLRGRIAGGRLLLEVEDECGGIPDTTRDLFHAFERRATDRPGVGLGLSIARKAVASQDGNIVVRNMPGKGCVFVIDLPLGPEESSAPGRLEMAG
jgi:signal transduction histidine kinase